MLVDVLREEEENGYNGYCQSSVISEQYYVPGIEVMDDTSQYETYKPLAHL